jgi:hypothetical protein
MKPVPKTYPAVTIADDGIATNQPENPPLPRLAPATISRHAADDRRAGSGARPGGRRASRAAGPAEPLTEDIRAREIIRLAHAGLPLYIAPEPVRSFLRSAVMSRR